MMRARPPLLAAGILVALVLAGCEASPAEPKEEDPAPTYASLEVV